ncbi:hypothetical protein [Hoeflea sp. TYP-13]|uniref:hypothetical protein n=1 Tax=Hoeflea sp. TYP-13 TaxID=3230023 RepID=UPI0034C641B7
MDTNPKAELEDVRQRRAVQMAQVRQGDLRAVIRDEMKPNYLADGPDKPAILDLCMEMAMALGPEVFNRVASVPIGARSTRRSTRGSACPAH